VRADASRAEVLAAYRRLSRSCHPDAGGNPGLFRLLTTARDQMLSDSGRRSSSSWQPPQASGSSWQPPRASSSPRASAQPGETERDGWEARDEYVHIRSSHTGYVRPRPNEPACPRPTRYSTKCSFTDLLAALPTPMTARAWLLAFACWSVIRFAVGKLGFDGLGSLLGLGLSVSFPLLVVAAVIRRVRRSQAGHISKEYGESDESTGPLQPHYRPDRIGWFDQRTNSISYRSGPRGIWATIRLR
jgi:hypothetical protein